MDIANEIYNDLMVTHPDLACKVDVNDIKLIRKINKPRLRRWIKKQKKKEQERARRIDLL